MPGWLDSLVRLILIAVGAFPIFLAVLWLLSSVVSDITASIAAVVLAFLVFPAIALSVGRKPRSVFSILEQARAAGELEITEYSVSEAVQIEEYEDEGLSFFLAVGPQETLFLTGQYLYDVAESGAFPSSRIRVLRNKIQQFAYDVESLGEPLTSLKRLPPFDERYFGGDLLPEDGDLIPQPLEAVVSHLKLLGAIP